jgi:hypothetical protein
MSKIENYKKEKNDHLSMIEQAYKAMNEGKFKDNQRDKFGLSIGGKWHEQGESMGYLTGHSGFYGSSGCTYQCSSRLARYLKIVINKKMKELVDEAIILSQKDVEDIRLIAEDEAKSVLLETKI